MGIEIETEGTIGERHFHLLSEIIRVNKAIGQIYDKRRSGAQADNEKLRELHARKDRLIIEALELRKNGDALIYLTLFGKQEDELHPFSRNLIKVSFIPDDLKDAAYSTSVGIESLLRWYEGDLLVLMETPDKFRQERTAHYILRTIREINTIAQAQQSNFAPEMPLDVLKVMLAERILQLYAQGEIDEGSLQVAPNTRFVEVSYHFEQSKHRKNGFRLLPPHLYLFPNQLKTLLDQGRNYDQATQNEARLRNLNVV